MAARLCICLLGSFGVTLDGQATTGFATDKTRALLAYLAVEADRPHRRQSLAGLLWPEHPEQYARASLRTALMTLRRAIGDHEATPPFLEISQQTIQFNAKSHAWVDVNAFTDLLDHRAPVAQTTQRLEDAVALYRGDFLEGFSLPDSAAYDEWVLLTRETLRRQAVEVLGQLVDCYVANEEYEVALPHAWRRVALDPWREQAQRQLMRLLALSGQRSFALAQYKACSQLLAEELGKEPAPETKAVYRQILAAEIGAPAGASGPPPHNLPLQPTPFVGREAVLACIVERLEDPACRLLTLVGPGGCGKTRLALEAAERQLERYPHGVYFVSLAPLNSEESVLPAVADAIGFAFYEGSEPRQQLLDYLQAKTMLLILDNYEHLLVPSRLACQASTALVTDILRTACGVQVLATSRARLNVGGEHRLPIAGMQYPDWEKPIREPDEALQYSAVKLFLQGARRAKPGFELTRENFNGVVQICRLVEGMPLAIRLAAPWAAILSPGEIALELTQSIDLLATDCKDVPARQRSVRATLDYTWRLLTERDRELMRALSIFRGGFAREAARAATGATLRELMVLMDKSLLCPAPTGRHEIHELLRQYAEEKLETSPVAATAARDRHCAYYSAALQRWAPELKGPRQFTALAEMRADRENIRATWDWALAGRQVGRLDQALASLCQFYHWRGRFLDGEAMCREAATTLGAPAQEDRRYLLARLLAWQTGFCLRLGRASAASELCERSLSLVEGLEVDTRALRAAVRGYMGWLAFLSGDNAQARRSFGDSLALWRALGDRWGQAAALCGLGHVAWSRGAYDEARTLAQHSLALRRSLGDQRGMADSLGLLGLIAAYWGQMDESVRLRRESVAIRKQLNDRPGAAEGLFDLATGLIWSGEFAEAQSLLQESREIYDDLGSRGGVANANTFLGWIDVMHGRYAQAHLRIENSLLSLRETSYLRNIGVALLFLGMLALAEEDYAAAQRLSSEAADLYADIGQWGEWALATASMGYTARALGDTAQAQKCYYEALQKGAELHATGLFIMPIPTVALLLADAGDADAVRAVEIYALASRYPYVTKSRFYEDIVGRYIAAVAATLPPDAVAAAEERGRARDLWATAKELAEELKMR